MPTCLAIIIAVLIVAILFVIACIQARKEEIRRIAEQWNETVMHPLHFYTEKDVKRALKKKQIKLYE